MNTDRTTSPADGHLILRRTTVPGFNAIAIVLDASVDRRAAVGDVLSGGVMVEVLDVEETQSGRPKVHLGIRAPSALRIERQEAYIAPQRIPLPGAFAFALDRTAVDGWDEAELERRIAQVRDELATREDAIRRLREEVARGSARGYRYPNNDSHLLWRALKDDLVVHQEQRDRLAAFAQELREVLAARRRASSVRQARDFFHAFFDAARAELDADTLERVTQLARRAVEGGDPAGGA
jgi:sRNA-binding carbon storage regulator CsrA